MTNRKGFVATLVEEKTIIDDYVFITRYTDEIGRDRYIFKCIECNNLKEVSDNTVNAWRNVKSFKHKESGCINYRSVKVRDKIKREYIDGQISMFQGGNE